MPLKGKQLTLSAKLLAVAIVLISLGFKSVGYLPGVSMLEVIQSAGFIVAIFAPIDLSLVFDTIFNKRSAPVITSVGGQ